MGTNKKKATTCFRRKFLTLRADTCKHLHQEFKLLLKSTYRDLNYRSYLRDDPTLREVKETCIDAVAASVLNLNRFFADDFRLKMT